MTDAYTQEQCRRLINGMYLVKGQGGYRHAAKQFFKGRQDFNPSNLADHPTEYPAVCQFHYDTQFNQYRARIQSLDAYRSQLNRLLADLDRDELATA